MIVRGKDRGDAVEYMAKARKLREYIKVFHEVAIAV